MSSWKKASKSGQREHRERHQPESRKHLGFLEKKKDYKLRAKAYEEKKNKLKKLKKKALNRNPDEFHFHMINSEMKDGLHYEKEKSEEYTEAQLKLMQSQDIRYVSYKQSTEIKKIEKLKAVLHMLDYENKPQNTHTFFVDSEKKRKEFASCHQIDSSKSPKLLECDEEIKKMKRKQYRELSKRLERERELSVLYQKLDVKKKLLNKNDPPAKKISEGTTTTPPVYKWKKERKR